MIALQMNDAQMDQKGAGHIDFTLIIVKSKLPGEDQRISIGYGLEDMEILPFDHEDLGNGNTLMSSQMLAFNETDFLQLTEHAITYFPPSVPQILHTIVSMPQVLHQNEHANMSKVYTYDHVHLENLNSDIVHNAIAKARNNPSVCIVSTCSLLARKILFCNGELNLLLPGSGCSLQAGTGHGLPGQTRGLCGCAVTSLLQRDCGGGVC
jgi:hypothetical protein